MSHRVAAEGKQGYGTLDGDKWNLFLCIDGHHYCSTAAVLLRATTLLLLRYCSTPVSCDLWFPQLPVICRLVAARVPSWGWRLLDSRLEAQYTIFFRVIGFTWQIYHEYRESTPWSAGDAHAHPKLRVHSESKSNFVIEVTFKENL